MKDLSDAFIQAIVAARTAYFSAHNGHNYIKGPCFFADHAFLNESYDALLDAYDRLVEMAKWHKLTFNLESLNAFAAQAVGQKKTPEDAKTIFEAVQHFEEQFQEALAELNKLGDLAVQNLCAGLAEDSNVRAGKIGRRLET